MCNWIISYTLYTEYKVVCEMLDLLGNVVVRSFSCKTNSLDEDIIDTVASP